MTPHAHPTALNLDPTLPQGRRPGRFRILATLLTLVFCLAAPAPSWANLYWHAENMVEMGWQFLEEGKLDESIDLFEQALPLLRNHTSDIRVLTLTLWALALYEKNELDKAESVVAAGVDEARRAFTKAVFHGNWNIRMLRSLSPQQFASFLWHIHGRISLKRGKVRLGLCAFIKSYSYHDTAEDAHFIEAILQRYHAQGMLSKNVAGLKRDENSMAKFFSLKSLAPDSEDTRQLLAACENAAPTPLGQGERFVLLRGAIYRDNATGCVWQYEPTSVAQPTQPAQSAAAAAEFRLPTVLDVELLLEDFEDLLGYRNDYERLSGVNFAIMHCDELPARKDVRCCYRRGAETLQCAGEAKPEMLVSCP